MNWIQKPLPPVETVESLEQALKIPRLNAQLLTQRSIFSFDAAKAYFRPHPEQLHDPFLMAGMEAAVQRLEQALKADEKVMIYGDYDVDGTSAVSLVYTYFSHCNFSLETYIPDRYTEGYGVSIQGIDYAASKGISLIVALDCGIKAVDRVAYAKTKNIDFIIGDHHKPGSELPAATAILNPKQPHCNYPYKELCGCGIGFKLVQAFHSKNNGKWEEIAPLLDLVVTATAADIVPMTGENRTLAALGLQHFQKNARPGLKALLGERKSPYRISDIVFGVAPRINAAGRMKHAKMAVELLTSYQSEKTQKVATSIEQFNEDRRAIEKTITEEALQQIDTNEEKAAATSVVFQKNWHKGVIGIVASRLTETYYRPTIVCCQSGDQIVGSVRSVKGFDVYQVLDACSDHLIQFGGHKYAAGLSLDPSNYVAFKQAFEKTVQAQILPEQQQAQWIYDVEVDFDQISPKVFRIIEQMRPFGPGNMRPVFCTKNCVNAGFTRVVGKDKSHLKLDINDSKGNRFSGIGFGLAKAWEELANNPFDILYCLEENNFNDRVRLELQVKDIRPTKSPT